MTTIFPNAQNNPAGAIPVYITSGGGGGGGLSDTILTDDSGTYFLARDNGTTITYVTLAGVAYTPSTNIRPDSIAGPATVFSGQTGIATTGTAVQFPSNTVTQGGFIRANINNAGVGFIGNSNVTNAVYPATGGGYRLNPGDALPLIASVNLNNNWVNGTAGDSFDYYGN